MQVIRPDIDRLQDPLPNLTGFPNRGFGGGTHRTIQFHGRMFERGFVIASLAFVGREKRCAVFVVIPIRRATFIAMQPRAVTTECDEIGARNMLLLEVRIMCAHRKLLKWYGTASGSDLMLRPRYGTVRCSELVTVKVSTKSLPPLVPYQSALPNGTVRRAVASWWYQYDDHEIIKSLKVLPIVKTENQSNYSGLQVGATIKYDS